MKKVALLGFCFIALLAIAFCTPRPEEGKAEDGNGQDSRQSDPEREYYILPIETVDVTRGSGGTTIAVSGPLGDGCQKFAYMDSVKSGMTLNLTFWASRPKAKNVPCTMIMQYLNREIVVGSGEYGEVAVQTPNKSVIRKPL